MKSLDVGVSIRLAEYKAGFYEYISDVLDNFVVVNENDADELITRGWYDPRIDCYRHYLPSFNAPTDVQASWYAFIYIVGQCSREKALMLINRRLEVYSDEIAEFD